MTPEEWAELDAAAKRADRTGPWLLRYLVRTFCPHVAEATLPVVGATVRQRCGNGAATVSASCPGEDTRAHAPPRESSDQQQREIFSYSDDGREQTPADEIANLLRTLRWYGARLAKDTGPEQFAASLLKAFPKVAISEELHKASAWLGESPKRRKQLLGPFLLGWMGRVGKGPKPTAPTKPAKPSAYKPEEWQ